MTSFSAAEFYKERKEAFVSNTVGGSVWRVNAICGLGLTSYLVYASLFLKYGEPSKKVQYLVLVVPLLSGLTVLSDWPLALNAALLLLFGVISYTTPPDPTLHASLEDESDKTDLIDVRRRACITMYRAHLMIMTVICILAVDFPIFPREFAKTETWGTSVMDLGVGSFVFSMGIVTAFAMAKNRATLAKTPVLIQIKDSLLRSLRVIALGVVRLIMVKGVEYPEHITEYGRHWNFFFTIGLMPLFGTLTLALFRKQTSFTLVGLFISLFHQKLYDRSGLQVWTLDAPRTDLLSENKEGIVSFVGYLATYFISIGFGFDLLVRRESAHYSKDKYDVNRLPLRLAIRSALFWAFYYFYTEYMGSQPSRRLCNLPYVLWVTAFNTSFIFAYYAVYEYGFIKKITLKSSLFSLINKHGMAVFLIANLLTGVVNLTVPTIFLHDILAYPLLLGYTAVVSLIPSFL